MSFSLREQSTTGLLADAHGQSYGDDRCHSGACLNQETTWLCLESGSQWFALGLGRVLGVGAGVLGENKGISKWPGTIHDGA